jgi:hypothetical protein
LLSRLVPRAEKLRAVAERFPWANRLPVPPEEMLSISVVENEFRRKPEAAPRSIWFACGVLDGCSLPRNQAPHQNLINHW